MPNTAETFWSGSINPSSSSIPKTLLKQQAISLGVITKNIVEATISSTIDEEKVDGFIDPPKITHSFDIIAPLLGYQRFTLFQVKQAIGLEYPVSFFSNYVKDIKYQECNDIQQVNENLKQILASKETANLINSIIAQSS